MKESSSRTGGRVLGGVTVASLVAAVSVLVVGIPLVGRVGGDPAFAGTSLVRTVQDSTVVCTVPELHGKSGFLLGYTPNFTGPSTYPASLDVYTGNANHSTTLAYILSPRKTRTTKRASPSTKTDVGARAPSCL